MDERKVIEERNDSFKLIRMMEEHVTDWPWCVELEDDKELVRFEHDLVDQIGEHRSRGVIIDVAALDVIDSFAALTLRRIAEMARLRGALTVVVGIQPEVAFTMVQLGMGTGNVPTALDLEEGLQLLAEQALPAGPSRSSTAGDGSR